MCSFLEDNFTVFKRTGGGVDSKPELLEHYKVWGWLEFLSSVAQAPEFIKSGSGLTGLECAKIAKAYDVLVWASMKKDYNIAFNEAYKQK